MSETQSHSKFSFPSLSSVQIKNFSLYEKLKVVDLEFKKGVFCLAGANGLGKSTFLNLINYALTGIVVNPDKDFTSIVSTQKFYTLNKKFATKYFEGRVNEIDRELCSVELKFSIGSSEYIIERQLFESDELVRFEKIVDGQNTIEAGNTHELFNRYCKNITADIGLSSFDQFVFLQHFIFSFDEHHTLIFWNKEIMETALYLFFGVDADDAKKANELRKDVKRTGSLIRNFTYHKNKIVKDTEDLKKTIASQGDISIPEGIEEEYENLSNSITTLESNIEKAKNDIIQCDYVLAESSYKLTERKAEYQNKFNSAIGETDQLLSDEKVVNELYKFRDAVCQNLDVDSVFNELKEIIKKGHCGVKSDSGNFEELQKIDVEIGQLNDQIGLNQLKKERLGKELQENEKELITNKEKLLKLDSEFGALLKQVEKIKSSDFTGVISVYENQIADKAKEIETMRTEKSELEKELKKLERKLNSGYQDAEEKFLPLFSDYARNFLGLDVDIRLRNTSKGTILVLVIEDTERSDFYQLSESQRYFIDIALRMALIEYSCSQATVLIDTPEGSLDIAYESRAGKMFGDFVKSSFNLMMTANINTSQLLLELAKKCSKDSMILERMTEWTNLSLVQYEEESKILEAYKSIEDVLNNES